MNKMSMKEMPVSERPYERFENIGPEKMTDAELLSIIIKSGTKEETGLELAKKLLLANPISPGLRGLNRLSTKKLISIKGIGRVKAIQIKSVFELANRIAKEPLNDGITLDNPDTIAESYMSYMSQLSAEHFFVLLLDNRLRLIKELMLSKGTINKTIAQPRELFIEALKYEAVYFIVLHNHPSGDSTPSDADVYLTRRLKDCGDMLGIALMDHIIIGQGQYNSLKKMGLF